MQFEPDALQHGIRRVLACAPDVVYLTHYRTAPAGRCDGQPPAVADRRLRAAGWRSAALGPADQLAALEAGMGSLLLAAARRHGIKLDDAPLRSLLEIDIRLNAAGLQSWLQSGG
ncbi:MAG: hypothetical protein R3E68_21135 [Burkholderiaceae bacterium]